MILVIAYLLQTRVLGVDLVYDLSGSVLISSWVASTALAEVDELLADYLHLSAVGRARINYFVSLIQALVVTS